MQPFLRAMGEAQLTAAFIANYQGLAARLAELPGATVGQQSGVTWVDTGIPIATFNGIAHAEHADDTTIDAVLAHFRAHSIPFHWSLGPSTQADLEARLIARGFAFDEAEPAMAADLDAPPATVPPVADLTIVPVTTATQVAQWVQTWGSGAPSFVIDHWQTVYEGLWERTPPSEFTLYLGMRGGEPVGTVYRYCHAGVAAVHYVVTPPALRRQGIGAALTQHAMEQARALGYHIAVLTASPYGIGIYRRLGFHEFGSVSTYVWEPQGD